MSKNGCRNRIKRGQIYRVIPPGDPWIYRERLVLVVQNDIGNRFCPTIIVTPLLMILRPKTCSFLWSSPPGGLKDYTRIR